MAAFRSLTSKYIFLSSIIILFFAGYALAGFIFTHYMEGDAKKINIAGRERMLTYKIASHLHFITSNPGSAESGLHAKGAEKAMDDYEEALYALKTGSPKLGLEPLHSHDSPSRAQLNELIELWLNTQRPLLRNIIRSRAAGGSEMCDACHAAVRENIPKIELLVKAVEQHHDRELNSFNLFRICSLGILAAIIGCVFFFTRRGIILPVKKLMLAASEIEKCNFDVSVEVRTDDEIGTLGTTFNGMARNLKTLFNEKDEHLNELSILNEIAMAASRTLEMEPMLDKVMGAMLGLEYLAIVKKGAVFLCDEENRTLRIVASRGFSENQQAVCSAISYGECLCGACVQEDDVIISRHSGEDARHTKTYADAIPHGHIILPLRSRGRRLGALCLYIPADTVLPERKIGLYKSIADIISVAVQNAISHKQVAMLAQSIESNTDLIVITDTNGRIMHVNARAVEYLGYERDEIKGKHISLMHSPNNPDGLWSEIFNRTINNGGWRGEVINIKRDGREYPVMLSTSLVRYENNRVIAFIGIVRDITESKQAEVERQSLQAQLFQAQKLESVGRLAGGVAHDFNNMLSAILGYSELALMQITESNPLREKLLIIKEAGRKAADLTRQLLAFSRKQPLELKFVVISPVIDNMLKLLGPIIGENVAIETKLNSSGAILADQGRIEQVIMNLALNARDAMPGGGRILVETADVMIDAGSPHWREGMRAGSHVMLSVSDTGAGMSPEVRERIFEPFFTTKEAGKGTGLGLATVYGIVRQHNGQIEVVSEPGKGATFRIYLPAVSGETNETVWRETASASSSTGTILVVDDDQVIRRLVHDTMASLGYQVLQASCAAEALRMASTPKVAIDLLLTDIVMPDMNGFELARAVREKLPNARVIYMSGYADETISGYEALKPDENYIRKPLTPTILMNAVKWLQERAG